MIGYSKTDQVGKIKKKGKKKAIASPAVDKWNWIRQNVVKPMFRTKGIDYCEACEIDPDPRCKGFALGFAHRHKRIYYKNKNNEDLLGDFKQVALLGQWCHQKIEHDREKTEKLFMKLRGEE